eukprot:scaffold23961_cov131-Isochrysis_galbana.AAC.7
MFARRCDCGARRGCASCDGRVDAQLASASPACVCVCQPISESPCPPCRLRLQSPFVRTSLARQLNHTITRPGPSYAQINNYNYDDDSTTCMIYLVPHSRNEPANAPSARAQIDVSSCHAYPVLVSSPALLANPLSYARPMSHVCVSGDDGRPSACVERLARAGGGWVMDGPPAHLHSTSGSAQHPAQPLPRAAPLRPCAAPSICDRDRLGWPRGRLRRGIRAPASPLVFRETPTPSWLYTATPLSREVPQDTRQDELLCAQRDMPHEQRLVGACRPVAGTLERPSQGAGLAWRRGAVRTTSLAPALAAPQGGRVQRGPHPRHARAVLAQHPSTAVAPPPLAPLRPTRSRSSLRRCCTRSPPGCRWSRLPPPPGDPPSCPGSGAARARAPYHGGAAERLLGWEQTEVGLGGGCRG